MYLDAAATTPVRREVLEAMWPYLAGGVEGVFGNPSSRHETGERAGRALAEARERIAVGLGCRPAEVVLTSGGTEGDNLAVKGIALAAPRGRHVVVSAIEHEAVLASADHLRRLHGFDVTVLPVGGDGRVDADAFAAALRPDTTLASIQHANNEVGTIQPIAELAAVARARGVPFHVDAVQSAGWLDVGLDTLGADAITVSGHKLGAPKGVGALAVRRGIRLEPLLHGGGQERGRRSGTENVAGAVGLAAALDLAAETRAAAPRVARLRDAVVAGLRAEVPGLRVTGAEGAHRLPGHVSFCVPGTNGESVLLELERGGFTASSGSACAAGSDEASHVLLALGLDDDLARTAVRLTFGAETRDADARPIATAVRDAVAAFDALRR